MVAFIAINENQISKPNIGTLESELSYSTHSPQNDESSHSTHSASGSSLKSHPTMVPIKPITENTVHTIRAENLPLAIMTPKVIPVTKNTKNPTPISTIIAPNPVPVSAAPSSELTNNPPKIIGHAMNAAKAPITVPNMEPAAILMAGCSVY